MNLNGIDLLDHISNIKALCQGQKKYKLWTQYINHADMQHLLCIASVIPGLVQPLFSSLTEQCHIGNSLIPIMVNSESP